MWNELAWLLLKHTTDTAWMDAAPSGIHWGDVALAWLLLEHGTDTRLPLGIVMCSLHEQAEQMPIVQPP